ncbi:MAG: adenosylcobinamide-phosphate synthase CbiB [Bacillota bacterium]
MGAAMVAIACLTDLVLGDPPRLPHPVVAIGKMISLLEGVTYTRGKYCAMAAGAFMAMVVVGTTYLVSAAGLYLLAGVSPWLAAAAQVWLISTTLAARGLASAAGDVLRPLMAGDLGLAREMVGRIVGRDTSAMNTRDVVRASVETVAENTIDGIIAPLFYALVGGAPLALAYKAVNTLDSMVGYRNDRYMYFGRFSARLDDVANYIPARIGGLLLLAAAWITGRRAGDALRAVLRDAGGHPSPNSGIPEAAVAGALGVRLGGLNFYGGRESFRHYMGQEIYPLGPVHIGQAVDLMFMGSFLAVAAGAAACAVIDACLGEGASMFFWAGFKGF